MLLILITSESSDIDVLKLSHMEKYFIDRFFDAESQLCERNQENTFETNFKLLDFLIYIKKNIFQKSEMIQIGSETIQCSPHRKFNQVAHSD